MAGRSAARCSRSARGARTHARARGNVSVLSSNPGPRPCPAPPPPPRSGREGASGCHVLVPGRLPSSMHGWHWCLPYWCLPFAAAVAAPAAGEASVASTQAREGGVGEVQYHDGAPRAMCGLQSAARGPLAPGHFAENHCECHMCVKCVEYWSSNQGKLFNCWVWHGATPSPPRTSRRPWTNNSPWTRPLFSPAFRLFRPAIWRPRTLVSFRSCPPRSSTLRSVHGGLPGRTQSARFRQRPIT